MKTIVIHINKGFNPYISVPNISNLAPKERLPIKKLPKVRREMEIGKHYRYPRIVIETAVLIKRQNQDLSYRAVSEMMQKIGVKVSHKTVYQWDEEFGNKISRPACPRPKKYSLVESIVRCNGEDLILYRAVDRENKTFDILLRSKRNMRVAKNYFAKREA